MNNSRNSSLFVGLTENSYSFVGYLDYTSTSRQSIYSVIKTNAVPYIVEKISSELPNSDTLEAINEARNPSNLTSYNDFNAFLNSLED